MTWTGILDVLGDLGTASIGPFWIPALAWTALVAPLWLLLERSDRLHPRAEYRLLQVLLGTLPLGVGAAFVADLMPAAGSLSSVATGVVVLPSVAAAPAPSSSLTWQWTHLVGLATAGVGLVAVVSLGWLLLDVFASMWVRRLPMPSSKTLQGLTDRLADRLGVSRRVRTYLMPDAVVPVTLGGLEPHILLPADLAERREALRMTLLHELIHIRRYDDWALCLERLVGALFAAHPLVHALRRHVTGARERACDTAVLAEAAVPPGNYARLLTAFADGPPRPGRLGALSFSESPSTLTSRLNAMRSSVSSLLSSPFRLGAAALGLGLALTVGVVACSDSVSPPTSEEAASSADATTAEQTESIDDEEVFVVVEEQPRLIGGMQALHEEIQYPEAARNDGIEGRVVVQFVVDEEGAVRDPTIERGVHELLDEAAIQAIEQMEFEPGKQRGEPVKVQMALPVTFKLPGEDTATTSSANQRYGQAEVGPLQSENRQMTFQELRFDGDSVNGRIVDAATGQPLAGANVIVPNTTTGTVTGPDGSFTLRADASSVTASFVGYERTEARQ